MNNKLVLEGLRETREEVAESFAELLGMNKFAVDGYLIESKVKLLRSFDAVINHLMLK